VIAEQTAETLVKEAHSGCVPAACCIISLILYITKYRKTINALIQNKESSNANEHANCTAVQLVTLVPTLSPFVSLKVKFDV